MNKIILNNGVEIPNVGIGTFLLEPNDCYNSVLNALKLGYRLIDTANIYNNEVSVGRAIKASNINRKEIFVSTKLWPSEYEKENPIDQTLQRLNLEYIDLLFIHQPTKNYRQGYNQLIKAYNQGKIRSIGVSNFEGNYILDLLNEYDIIPQVFQCECHPFYPQTELRKIIDQKNIKLMSWYPLGGKGMTQDLLNNDIVTSLANKYNKSPAQVILKWHIQMGFIVIPGSKNIEHIKININIYDFNLTDKDMALISKLNNNQRRYIPDKAKLEHYLNFKPNYEKN